MRNHSRGTTAAFGAVAALSLLLAACSGTTEDSKDSVSESTASQAKNDETTDGEGNDGEQVEVATLPDRLVYTYDGGIVTMDPKSGETIKNEDLQGFLRLNAAGDDRHVMVTQSDRILSLDTGLITKPHGDHNHYYTADPKLTDASYDVPEAGHVVVHDGKTALFSDGTGEAQVFDTEKIGEGDKPKVFKSGEPHHGVAVPFKDGSILTTVGNEDDRHTIRHLDKNGKTLAETTDCPKIHGEATTSNSKVVFGCTNGPVVFDGHDFSKVDVSNFAGKGGYQRSGNLAGSEESNIVLGDNKVDEDAEHEQPTSVSLINAETNTAQKVELGSSYWFRSLGRGPKGEALVLTYDGKLNIIDPKTGKITDRIDAIEPWEEKEEWQEPGPILKVHGKNAYITDENTQALVVIDIAKKKKEINRMKLEHTPTEMEVL